MERIRPKKIRSARILCDSGNVCDHFEGRLMDDVAQRMIALRPRLHRYAARMMGSAFDGEDVVQDAMAKLAVEDAGAIVDLDAWMFPVTHNCAIDALRRRRRQAVRDAPAGIIERDSDPAGKPVAVAAGPCDLPPPPAGPTFAVALSRGVG